MMMRILNFYVLHFLMQKFQLFIDKYFELLAFLEMYSRNYDSIYNQTFYFQL